VTLGLLRPRPEGGRWRFFTNHYPADSRPEVQNFVKAFGAKYKDDKGSQGSDALAACVRCHQHPAQGIKEAGADDTAKVKER